MQITGALWVSKDGQRRFYSRQLRTLHFALILFTTLVLALGPTSEWANGDPQFFRRACLIVLAIGLLAALRVMRRGLITTTDRVVVRNLLWFRVVPTTSIERFEPSAGLGFHFGTGGLVVRTVSGKAIHAGVFVTTPVDGGGGVGAAEAKELNEWLAAVRSGVRFPAGSLVPAWKAHGRTWARWLWLTLLLVLVAFIVLTIMPALLDPTAFLDS